MNHKTTYQSKVMKNDIQNPSEGWKTIDWEECRNCGSDDVEVADLTGDDDLITDGAPAKCRECGEKGTCSVDDESAFIVWHCTI